MSYNDGYEYFIPILKGKVLERVERKQEYDALIFYVDDGSVYEMSHEQ